MDPLRPADKLVKRSLDLLKGDFVVVGKKRVSLFTLSLMGMFLVGAVAAFALLASRSGTLQGGFAAGVPSCSGIDGPALVNSAMGSVLFRANGIQNATDVKFAVWTDANGQDDLVWYAGKLLSGSTWQGTIDLSKHPENGLTNVHVWMFNGSSQALCGGRTFTKSLQPTETYQASADFSSTQGYRGWEYFAAPAGNQITYYASHAQCGLGPCWKGSQDHQSIYASGQHPGGSTGHVIRKWVAPAKGVARITGTVKDTGGICGGDGVFADVQAKGASWSKLINDGDSTGQPFDITTFTLVPGDAIIFSVSSLSNNYCDGTEFDPKIEFSPSSGGRVSIKEMFLPGVSASPVMLLDGISPEGQPGGRYWENVTPGTHVLSISGVPKVFYAACPDASECLDTPSEGSTIFFDHQFGKSDMIRVYFASATSEIVDAYAMLPGTPLRADSYETYNFSIVANNCTVNLYTDATEDYLTWAQQVATIWTATGVKINLIPDIMKGSQVKITSADDSTGYNDQISAMHIGAFDVINYAGEKIGGWSPYGGTIQYNHNKPEDGIMSFYPDIAIDIRDYPPSGTVSNASHMTAMKYVIAHEIGHLLGLRHNVDSNSVMHGEYRTYVLPSPADIDAIKAKYPSCAPKPAKVSISFSPSPATWWPTPRSNGKSTCRDGKMELPNGKWSSNLDIEETDGSSGAIMDKATLKQYDTSGVPRVTDTFNNFYSGLKVNAGSTKAVPFDVYPRAKFALGKITLKLSGKDDMGNTVETAEKTLPLKTPPKGQEKLAKCKNDPAEPWPILGSGFVPTPQ